jgi:hypothetical protein
MCGLVVVWVHQDVGAVERAERRRGGGPGLRARDATAWHLRAQVSHYLVSAGEGMVVDRKGSGISWHKRTVICDGVVVWCDACLPGLMVSWLQVP